LAGLPGPDDLDLKGLEISPVAMQELTTWTTPRG